MPNILLGIGGTGAKTVEATLVLLAAGLGDRNGPTYIGLIDQDSTNGNIRRTRTLLAAIGQFRAAWTRPGRDRIDTAAFDAPGIGAIDVRPLFEEPEPQALWCPTRRHNTLREIMGQNLSIDQRHLFDLLFSNDAQEQDKALGNGYGGRAHVGAAALTASLIDDDNVLLTRLKELMQPVGGGAVNIFLVGSAFGGTGASGFPTLARRLNIIRGSEGFPNRDGVRIGGLLMLPYFSFRDPDANETEAATVVTSDELMPKAQLALEHYENLFEHEPGVFDAFYALGWDPILPLDYHEPGSEEQTNPALAPELIAATAVLKFFTERVEVGTIEPGVVRHVSARRGAPLLWKDLPLADADGLASLLRFATYWRYFYEPQLHKRDRLFARNWARKLAENRDPEHGQDQLAALDHLLDLVLTWAATVEATGGPGVWGQGPWDLTDFLDHAHVATPTAPVVIKPAMDQGAAAAAFDKLIRDNTAKVRSADSHHIYDQLSRAQASAGGHLGLGRALATVYAATKIAGVGNGQA